MSEKRIETRGFVFLEEVYVLSHLKRANFSLESHFLERKRKYLQAKKGHFLSFTTLFNSRTVYDKWNQQKMK